MPFSIAMSMLSYQTVLSLFSLFTTSFTAVYGEYKLSGVVVRLTTKSGSSVCAVQLWSLLQPRGLSEDIGINQVTY